VSKYAQQFAQFNVKVVGEERVKIIDAAREYCARNQITISEFVVSALKNALDTGLLPESNAVSMSEVEGAIAGSLVPVLEQIELLRSLLEKLGNAYNEAVPQLKNSVWLLEQKVFASPPIELTPKTSRDDELDRLRCCACGQIGGHVRSGTNKKGQQLYVCGNPRHTTGSGGKYRSIKFEYVGPEIKEDALTEP
jgi:hypothetical protein